MSVHFRVDGVDAEVAREDISLLEALRDELGLRSPKDGCSPQGQCGCCTVLVDGAARVACVTAVRRVAGREVTTADGLPPEVAGPVVDALVATGGSQCGFCTPGILCRVAGLGPAPDRDRVTAALQAHLCRCTGWRTVVDAVAAAGASRTGGRGGVPDPVTTRPGGGRDMDAAARRATLEARTPQAVGAGVVSGRGGFADDTAPSDALVAVPGDDGDWVVAETLGDALRAAGKVQGRRSGRSPTWPLDVPPGDWDVTLRTTWVEPAYLEPDASWCEPGGPPASPLANGGAFGGKVDSPAPAAARMLADRHGRAVRVLLRREDVVRLGPKRPPLAAGIDAGGRGHVRVVTAPGIAEAIRSTAPGLVVEEVTVPGPPVSAALRAAGWAEAAILLAGTVALTEDRVAVPAGPGPAPGTSGLARVVAPEGGTATAEVTVDASGRPVAVDVEVSCGEPLDVAVLRSYVVGAAHMGLGWVLSEAVAVSAAGDPEDLTIRSWGILRARDTPDVTVRVVPGAGPPVNGSDAAFAAVAAATWIALGLPSAWPARRDILA